MKNAGPSSPWKQSTRSCRFFTGVWPWSTNPGRPNTPARNAASGSVISRNCEKTSTLSWRSPISSHNSPRPPNLAAPRGVIAPGPEPLIGVVADLLEAHDKGQHDPLAGDPRLLRIEGFPQSLDRLLVHGRLLAAEVTKRLQFDFVGQVADDRLVRLHPPQNVRINQAAQRAVLVARA